MEREHMMQKPKTVMLLALLCCFLWGSAFPCIKIGYDLFEIAAEDTMSQMLFAGCRFALAGILVILFGSMLRKHCLVPEKKNIGLILKLGMVQTVMQYVLFYIGLAHTTGVKSSIINASNVFISLIFASLLFRFEKLTAKKIAGCLIGFAGVVIINLSGGSLDASFSLKGEGAILLSTAAYALSSGMIKLYSQKENPVTLSGYQFLFGGLVMIIIAILLGGRIMPENAAAFLLLLYMALISAVAYTLWGILLKYNPVAKVAVFGFMTPVFGVLLSALLLGERNQAFGWRGIAALVLVCVGIYVVNKGEKIYNEEKQSREIH